MKSSKVIGTILVARHDLRGRKVRVIVLDEAAHDNPWLKSLRA